MSLVTTLFPPANREVALVAFLRTFWQVVKGTGLVSSAGYIAITASQLATIDIRVVGLATGAVLVSAILSGAFSGGNILINGLPAAYSANAVATIPVATVEVVDAPAKHAADPAPAPVAAAPGD